MRAPVLFLALGLAAGCATRSSGSPETGAMSRDATLSSVRGSGVSGTARAVSGREGTRVTVSLIGAAPNTAHPWHVHLGTCQSGGPVVGNPGAYPPAMVGSTGQGQGSASLGVVLSGAQNYHVNVHASATDMGTIVACGDLRD